MQKCYERLGRREPAVKRGSRREPAVKRGNVINKKAYVKERHSASDLAKFFDEEDEKIQKKRMNGDDSNNQLKEKKSKL